MTYVNAEAVNWTFERDVEGVSNKIVLLAIAKGVNKHWAAFPSHRELARLTGLAVRSIPKCLQRLEEDGHLTKVPFVASNGQDQKPGYVLAGCGHPLDALDADFLALAFASRKQPGVVLAAKPQHWSGERKGEGRSGATLPGSPASDPEGRSTATPRSKEHTEDRKVQEDAFGEAAVPAAPQDQKQAAIAEVRAGAPTSDTDHQGIAEARIPMQRQQQDRRSDVQKRDDDWRAQIAAADHNHLQIVLDEYNLRLDSLWEWAMTTAGLDMGLAPDKVWVNKEDKEEQFRAAYLWLLKKHADDDSLYDLLQPLDLGISAPVPGYRWDEHCAAPPGMTVDEFVDQMRRALEAMTVKEWGPQITEIRNVRSGIWAQSRQKAKAYLRGQKLPVEAASINYLAIWYTILHYRKDGKWPAAVVPPSLRLMSLVQGSAPSWAA